jgi:steroid Delta-isomerase
MSLETPPGRPDPLPYIRYYETLSRASVGELRGLAAPDMRFADPFNDLSGVERIVRMLERMFDDLDEPRFAVTDRAASGAVWYLRWRFSARLRGRSTPWTIEGMTEVHYDDRGRVTAHLDHWDSGAQFYAKLPVIGWLIGLVRRRLRAG